MNNFAESPQVIVLGGGLDILESGQTILAPISQARVYGVIALYTANPEIFNRSGSVIVCSGNASILSSEAYAQSEAALMADQLVAQGVPHQLVEIEDQSNNTLTNYLYSADVLEQRLAAYNGSEVPNLTVVTHGWHYQPRARFLGELCLNRPLQNAAAVGEPGLRRRAQEAVLYAGYKSMLAGIEPGNRVAITARAQKAGSFVTSIKAPLSSLWQT